MFDVNARFVAMNMNALKVSKKMCKDCLLVNYSLFNFPGKIVFNGGGGWMASLHSKIRLFSILVL